MAELRAGQRVAAFPDDGGYAEIAVARPVLTYPLPDGVPDEAGASLTMLVTAYNLLATVAQVQPGEAVLIHSAAGGVGTIAVQMAKALGAGAVIAVAGGAEKVALAHDLGADVTVDHTREDVADRVRAATNDRGVDVVLDAVGGDTFDATLPLLAEFGRYCIYGQASGEPGTAKTNVLHGGNRAVLGVFDRRLPRGASGTAPRRRRRRVRARRRRQGPHHRGRAVPAARRGRGAPFRRVARKPRQGAADGLTRVGNRRPVERHREDFGDVQRAAVRAVLDLVLAAHAVGDDERVRIGGAHRR